MMWRDRQLGYWFICLLLISSAACGTGTCGGVWLIKPTYLQRERTLRLQGERAGKCGWTSVFARILRKSRDSGWGFDLFDSNRVVYSLLVRQTCERKLLSVKKRDIGFRAPHDSGVAC